MEDRYVYQELQDRLDLGLAVLQPNLELDLGIDRTTNEIISLVNRKSFKQHLKYLRDQSSIVSCLAKQGQTVHKTATENKLTKRQTFKETKRNTDHTELQKREGPRVRTFKIGRRHEKVKKKYAEM